MILVIGGAGYIGSHMLKLLRDTGEEHLVLDNFEHGHREALLDSPFVEGDLRSREDLEDVFAQNKIDLVMHFAAYISVGESVESPAKYWDNNTVGVINLLDCMRAAKIDKFVFSSTAAIFGEPEYVPIDEEHPKRPTNPYGASKLAVEQILDSYDRAYKFRSVCLRYFNAAGADPSGIIGEDHHPEEHLIPVAMEAASGKRPGMKIFGTDYDTPDGTCVRDYIHILDLAEAHLLAVNHLRRGGESRRYNLGNGKGFSVKEIIEKTARVIGKEVPHEFAERRPGDPARLIASSEKIRADWGWNPKYKDVEEIIRHAWNWHSTHPDGYATTGTNKLN